MRHPIVSSKIYIGMAVGFALELATAAIIIGAVLMIVKLL